MRRLPAVLALSVPAFLAATAGGPSSRTSVAKCPEAQEVGVQDTPAGQILFTSRRGGGGEPRLADGLHDAELYLINADGTGERPLADNTQQDYDGAWSPDGSRIAFGSRRDGGNREVYVMNPDGTEQTRLTTNLDEDRMPSWSPDGRWITFVRVIPGPGDSPHGGDEEIHVMRADGSAARRLTHSLGVDVGPRWRPVRR